MSTNAESRQTEHIPEWKREEVAALTETIDSYGSVGVVDLTGIPSRQLQNMRRDLHGRAELRVSRNTLLLRALEEADDGVERLEEYVTGQVGLIGTNDNPFGLFRQLEASKTPAPINAGEVAPNEIVIPAGDTGVDPGPFVGELQQVGAAARIMDGSIHVTEDSTVAAAGDTVTEELAGVLSELGVEPKEVGLDLRAVYSEGVLFEPDELAIDLEEYRADVRAAATAARNLSINAVYPTAGTAPALLAKASAEAKSVGLRAAIEDESLLPDLVRKADGFVRALATRIDDQEALPEALRDAVADEEPTGADDSTDTDDSTDADESTDEEPAGDEGADDEDDEDDEDAGDALGAMFG